MNIWEIKQKRDQRRSAILTKHGVFFAFNEKQFEENKTPLKEGEKYVRLGGGGYMPKGNVDAYLIDLDENEKWFKGMVKSNKQRRAHIAYELSNHECFYTRDIDSALSALGEGYTREEVYKVYIEESKKANY